MSAGIRAGSSDVGISIGGVEYATLSSSGLLIPAGQTYAHAARVDQVPQVPFRNRLINPDMAINQVYGGTAVTPTATSFVTDQWTFVTTQASKLTFQQVADAPAGLKYSTKISVASQFSPGAADAFALYQNIEGQNIIDFQLGTAGAVTIVTSQWIKGSVAGTYTVSLSNAATNRSYVGTVSVTTGWQRLSISLVGDTTGTWATDTTAGLTIRFDLGSGSNFNATAGSWQAGNFLRTSGSVTFVNQVAGSTLNITGVQVEAVPTGATTPTAFEFLPYEIQLRRAQRYLPVFSSSASAAEVGEGAIGGASTAFIHVYFSVPTRVTVTGVITSSAASYTVTDYIATASAASAMNVTRASTWEVLMGVTTSAVFTPPRPAEMSTNTATPSYIAFTGAQL